MFIKIHYFYCLGFTNFMILIFQKLLISYAFYTIKQFLIYLFFSLFFKKILNQVLKKDDQ